MERHIDFMMAAIIALAIMLSAPASAAGTGKVEMSLDEFRQLTAASQALEPAKAPPVPYAIESAEYTATADGTDLRVTVRVRVFLAEDKPIGVPLFPAEEGLAVGGFNGAAISLDQESRRYVAVLEKKGAHEFSLEMTAALGSGPERSARFPAVRSASGSITLKHSRDERALVSPALGVTETEDNGARILRARLPSSDYYTVTLGPIEGEAYRFSRADYTAVETNGGLKLTAELALTVNAYPEAGIPVLANDQALSSVKVDGKDHPVFFLNGAFVLGRLEPGPRVVRVEWFMPARDSEQVREAVIPIVPAPITTLMASVSGEAMEVEVKPGLNRESKSQGGRTMVTVSLPMTSSARLTWTGKSPETRKLAAREDLRMYAERYSVARMEEGLLTMEDTLLFRVLRGETDQFETLMPAGVEVVSVEGPFIKSWSQENVEGGRRCRVTLDQPVHDSYKLKIVTETLFKEPPLVGLSLPALSPQGIEREKGIIAIQSSPDLEIKPSRTEGLRRVEADRTIELRRLAPLYAFQYLTTPYALSVDVALKPAPDPDAQADVEVLANIGDGFVEALANIRYVITNTGIDAFPVVLPAGVKVTAVRGQGIRNYETVEVDGRAVTTAYLERPVMGQYRLYLEYQRVLGVEPKEVEVPLPRPEGVSYVDGLIGIAVSHNLEIKEKTARNLRAIDLSQLRGGLFGTTEALLVKSYSYSWTRELDKVPALAFELLRHRDVAVQDAIIDEARYLTLVHENNFCVTKAVLSIRNRNRQNLRLTLPPDSELWSAFLAEESVPPARDGEGNILIPLPKSELGADGRHANFPVEIVYKTRIKETGRFGRLELVLPRADIVTGKATWQLYLPAEKTWRDYAGNMGSAILEERTAYDVSRDLAAFAQSLSGNFLKFQAKAKQSEAKTNLGAIFTTQVAFFGEHGEFGDGFKDVHWAPEGRNMYTYYMGSDHISGVSGDAIQVGGTKAGGKNFIAVAAGNIDNDPFPDIWVINDAKVLENLADDSTDTYSPKFEEYKRKGLLAEFDLSQLAAIQDRMRQSELRGLLSLRIEVPTQGKLVKFEKLFPGAQGELTRVDIQYLPGVLGKGAVFLSRLFAVALGGGILFLAAVMVRRHERLGWFRRHWWLTVLAITGALVLVFRAWFA